MTLYFADRTMKILNMASTGLPGGFKITNDVKTDEVENGAATLEFDIAFRAGEQQTVDAMTCPGNYILRNYNDESEFYTIITSELDMDSRRISVYAEGAGLDLLNEISTAYEASTAMPIADYINKFAYDSGFEIGINEISDRSRTLSWDGESTVMERLLSVATQFDAEIGFSFEISGMTVTGKYINVYKQRGDDLGLTLRRGVHVGNIVITKSVEDVCTALKVTGGTPEGEEDPINLNGYEYDDGDFYLDGTYLKSRTALAKWSRYLSESGDYTGHIMRTFTYDTTSQSELCNRAISELQDHIDMTTTYEVEMIQMPKSLKVGGVVNIVDNSNDLYLTARLLKLEVSAANKTQKATFGDFEEESA